MTADENSAYRLLLKHAAIAIISTLKGETADFPQDFCQSHEILEWLKKFAPNGSENSIDWLKGTSRNAVSASLLSSLSFSS